MSEIEKMYRNSGIKKIELDYPDNFEPFYPEFTAEKQIELIKFLYIKYKKYEMFKVSNRDEVGIRTSENTFYAYGIDIQNAIANFFNRNWQDLTEKEKQQVKGILSNEK